RLVCPRASRRDGLAPGRRADVHLSERHGRPERTDASTGRGHAAFHETERKHQAECAVRTMTPVSNTQTFEQPERDRTLAQSDNSRKGNSEKAVIPAQAGIQNLRISWAPAFAGMTIHGFFRTS